MNYVLLGQIIAYRDWPINLIARFGRGDIPAMMRSNLSISCEGEHGLDAIVPPRNFFSVKKALCNGDMPIYEAGGRLLQADTMHLTETGAVFVAERLVKWLDDNGHLQVRRADRRAD